MKKILLIVALAGMSTVLSAQSLQFLGIPADTRTAAMAGAGVALDAGAMASEVNAAASVMTSNKFAIGANFSPWAKKVDDIKLASFGTYYNFGKFALGLSGRYCMEGAYDVYNDVAQKTGTFTPKELAVAVSGAFKVGDKFGLGVTARLASSNLGETASAKAFGADVSAMYSGEIVKVGLAVCNLGPKVKYGDVESKQPSLAKAGLSFETGGFVGGLEADILFAGGFAAGIGAEYTIVDIVSLRAGYHIGGGANVLPSHASVGLGLKFAGVNLNATYLLGSKTLGGTMCFGLGYAF